MTTTAQAAFRLAYRAARQQCRAEAAGAAERNPEDGRLYVSHRFEEAVRIAVGYYTPAGQEHTSFQIAAAVARVLALRAYDQHLTLAQRLELSRWGESDAFAYN